MTYQELYRFGTTELENAKIENAAYDARELLLGISGLSRSDLALQFPKEASLAEAAEYRLQIARRKEHYPLQYLLGEWEFYGLTLKVGEGVLIPRPETELLVDIALDFLNQTPSDTPVEIWDLCAGSGCVGLAIAANFPDCRVFSLEKSEEAFSYLEQNIRLCHLADRVTPIPGDLLAGPDSLPKSCPCNPKVIVSNPPYIRKSDLSGLQEEVRFEPSMALDGGDDGLVFYHAIAKLWLPRLSRNGLAVLESGEDQKADLLALFQAGSYEVTGYQDYAGMERGVVVRT